LCVCMCVCVYVCMSRLYSLPWQQSPTYYIPLESEFIGGCYHSTFKSVRATVRTLLSEIRTEVEKNDQKSSFFRNLATFPLSYRLEMLNQGKGYQVTSFRGVLKHLDYRKLVYYSKKGPKLAEIYDLPTKW